jgi:electron transfer flavoprotein beta subunit
MKIVVLIKHVPDTETRIKLGASGASLDAAEFKYMVNPYDEFAIEEAVRTQEKQGGESVVISAGPTRCQEALRKALAMGIDRAIWINTEAVAGQIDSTYLAGVLAQACKEESPDVVFAGQMSIDDAASHIGPMVGEYLGVPSLQIVTKIQWQEGAKSAVVEREVEGGMVEVYNVQTPFVVGANKSLNEPRFPSLPGIMKAKKKPLAEKSASELASAAGIKSLVQYATYALPAEKAQGKIFKGKPVEEMVKEVVQLLRSEAKVI